MITDGGVSGWELVDSPNITTEYPRNLFLPSTEAQAASSITGLIWKIKYREQDRKLYLFDPYGKVVNWWASGKITKCDLALDAEDNPTIVTCGVRDDIFISFTSPLDSQLTTLSITGKYPCCLLGSRHDNLPVDGDITIYYQRVDSLYYRLQSENFSVEYSIPWTEVECVLKTCALDETGKPVLRIQSTNATMFVIGDKVVGIDNDYVGYPDGEYP